MVNQITVTAHIFDNLGNLFLRTEDICIPLPAIFVPCTSPRGDMNIKTKYENPANGHCVYLELTIEEINELMELVDEDSIELDDGDLLESDDGNILLMD